MQAWLGGKSCFLIWMLQTFDSRFSSYFWDTRLKILMLLNFNMFFQLVLTKFFKSELFSCLPKVDHVISSDAKSLLPSGIWWHTSTCAPILGDPGTIECSWWIFHQDLTAVNFHHEHSIVPTNCPWVFQGEKNLTDPFHQFNYISVNF